MKKILTLFTFLILSFSCSNENNISNNPETEIEPEPVSIETLFDGQIASSISTSYIEEILKKDDGYLIVTGYGDITVHKLDNNFKKPHVYIKMIRSEDEVENNLFFKNFKRQKAQGNYT